VPVKGKVASVDIIQAYGKIAGSNPAEALDVSGEKILSTPSFRGEVKLSVPCRRFAAC